jgi:predicted nucleic acid-binding Zn ribbon protein
VTNWKSLDDDSGPRRVGESLDGVVRKLGVARAAAIDVVFARWAEVVGDAVAAHAQPTVLRRGTLVVAVDDPAWATELRFLATDIARRCCELAGPDAVSRIDVKVTPKTGRTDG